MGGEGESDQEESESEEELMLSRGPVMKGFVFFGGGGIIFLVAKCRRRGRGAS